MAIEEPDYEVVKHYDGFELRRYSSYVVAETEVTAGFEAAGNDGFRRLFRFIGGANAGNRKIPMTAPVGQSPGAAVGQGEAIPMTAPVTQRSVTDDGGAETHMISFAMPKSYTMATVPKPTDARIRIREVPARLVAARRYRGGWGQAAYQKHVKALLKGVGKAGITTTSSPFWARYNSPFSLPILRRNEVLVTVDAAAAE